MTDKTLHQESNSRKKESNGDLTCCFCKLKGFKDLDEIYSHQITVTSEGMSLCPYVDRLDGTIWEKDIIPNKIGDDKYAPKNGQGEYIYYNSKAEIVNKSLIKMLLEVYA